MQPSTYKVGYLTLSSTEVRPTRDFVLSLDERNIMPKVMKLNDSRRVRPPLSSNSQLHCRRPCLLPPVEVILPWEACRGKGEEANLDINVLLWHVVSIPFLSHSNEKEESGRVLGTLREDWLES